ncbi:MAG: 50S ribosomal protein L31 [Candidatus Omnitrophica bacterium]|nr:50S ribosomal protein L31 [Candidatus Omnitrophota bacterium]
MKEKIHPKYQETTIVCACGASIHTRSTKQNIHVDVCSSCHPFFTGKQKLMDSAGRVDKFKRRYEKKKEQPKAKKESSKPSASSDQKGLDVLNNIEGVDKE